MLINTKIGIMKRIYNYIAFILVFAITYSCKTDNMNYVDPSVTPVANLYAPLDNAAIKLSSSSGAVAFFEWESALGSDGGTPQYEVVFDEVGGDFSTPLYKVVAGSNGFASSVNILHKTLNTIANAAGIDPGTSGDIQWTVISSRGIKQERSQQVRKINLTALTGFADKPAEVFITGEGSEGSADVSMALPFKQVGEGTFEIYTKLEAGKNYAFVDRRSETPRVFYTDDQSRLKEGTDDNHMTSAKTGVYRIELDFTTASIAYTEIKSIGLWFSPDNKILFDLPYAGKGVWTGTGIINFKTESWGKDERYKFQMETVSGGKNVTVQLGAKNATDSRPNASSDPSYYYTKWLSNVTQWDDKWKFADAVDGKSTTVSVLFQSDKEYTHIVKVN